MIRVNLLGPKPGRPRGRRALSAVAVGLGENAPFLLVVGATLLVVAGAWWYQSRRLDRLEATLRAVQAERQQLAEIADRVAAIEESKAIIDRKLQVVVELKRNQSGPLLLLDQISRLLPDGLWLTTLDASEGAVGIQGAALSNVAIADFVANLKGSPYFDDVELRFSEDTGDAFRFQLDCRFTPRSSAGAPGATASAAPGTGG